MQATTQPSAKPTARRTTSSNSETSRSCWNEPCSQSGIEGLPAPLGARLAAEAVLRKLARAQAQVGNQFLERCRQRQPEFELDDDLPCQERQALLNGRERPFPAEQSVEASV